MVRGGLASYSVAWAVVPTGFLEQDDWGAGMGINPSLQIPRPSPPAEQTLADIA